MIKIINNGMTSNFDSNDSLVFCRDCNSPIIADTFRGDTICSKCGIIESEKEIDISNFNKNIFSSQDINHKSTHDPRIVMNLD